MVQKLIRVVILGGHVAALGILRCINYKNIVKEIWSTQSIPVSRFSKFCDSFSLISGDYKEIIEKLRFDNTYIKTVIFPTTDYFVKILSKNRKELLNNGIIPVIDDWSKVSSLYYKSETYKIAEELNIPHPNTYTFSNVDEIRDLDINYPVVVKPSVMYDFYRKHRKKAFLCDNIHTLKSSISIIEKAGINPVVQEYIRGNPNNNFSCCMARHNGKTLLVLEGKRRRQYPLDFGASSTYVETTDAGLVKMSEKLLDFIDIDGLFEVEFKYDQTSSSFKLLEVNPRVWKWHILAVDDGFNFPDTILRALVGIKIEKKKYDYEKMITWQDFVSDKLALFLCILKRYESLNTINPFAKSYHRKKDSVFDFNDPLPFLVYVISSISVMLGSR